MSYDFEPHRKKDRKHKINKWEKVRNKKTDTKNKKIKQKNLVYKQGEKEEQSQLEKGNDVTITWDDVISPEEIKIGYIAEKKGKEFRILDKSENRFFDAILSETIPSHLRGTFVVGDLVYLDDSKIPHIVKRGDRKNCLSKTRSNTARFGFRDEQVIAANIDIAVIVVPVKNPRFDSKLLDRYLVLCGYRGVKPVICINKIDLNHKKIAEIDQYKKSGILVVETSVSDGRGIEELKNLLRAKTVIFLGKSGVGKSSLTNALSAGAKVVTQNVNSKSGEGKHTTTRSSLYLWENDSYVIDTPGIRALGLDQIPKKELQYFFPEFEKYRGSCKYAKCLHESEPDCAIKNAVEDKKIDKWRYESYVRILQDLI